MADNKLINKYFQHDNPAVGGMEVWLIRDKVAPNNIVVSCVWIQKVGLLKRIKPITKAVFVGILGNKRLYDSLEDAIPLEHRDAVVAELRAEFWATI